MERIAIDSESIAKVGYDEAERVLEVLFRHGGLYRYFDVPAAEYAALMRAPSRGRHFVEHIRDAFRHLRLDEGSAPSTGADSV